MIPPISELRPEPGSSGTYECLRCGAKWEGIPFSLVSEIQRAHAPHCSGQRDDLLTEALALLHRCQPCGPIPLRAIVAEFLERAAEAGYTP